MCICLLLHFIEPVRRQALLPGATLGKLTATVPFHIPLSAKSQTLTIANACGMKFLLFLKQREDFNVVTKATQFVQYHLQTLICLNIKGCTLLSQQQRVYPYQRREKRW